MGDHHKGRAVDRLHALYERKYGGPISHHRDRRQPERSALSCLRSTSRSLIRKKNGKYDARIEIPGLVRTRVAGSAGWSEAVKELLER